MKQRTISPVDGSVYVERPLASPERRSSPCSGPPMWPHKGWKYVPVPERAAIVRRMVEWCVARADELGTELAWQMGRPATQSPNELRRGFQERALYMCTIAAEALSDLPVEKKEGFQRFIRREPLGVVLVVAPWNYPWLTSVNAVVPALLAGNAVVLKMAAQTPLVAERYAEAFAAAGLPQGVFQYLHMDHEETARVIADPRIGYVAFTGSVAGGQAVQRAASARFVGTGLELGGKDPAYVRADAALELDDREPGGRRLLQFRPVLLRRRAHLRAPRAVQAFRRRFRRSRAAIPARQSARARNQSRPHGAHRRRRPRARADRARDRARVRSRYSRMKDRPGSPYLPPEVLVDVDHGMADHDRRDLRSGGGHPVRGR